MTKLNIEFIFVPSRSKVGITVFIKFNMKRLFDVIYIDSYE